MLRTGAPWQDVPDWYPPYSTCHKRFQTWVKEGVLEQILRALAKDLERRGGINLSECFIDGTFAPAKKGSNVGKTKCGKGTKIMAVADGTSLPVAVSIASASPHEVTLAKPTIESRFTETNPERLIGDRAYDSDPLDRGLEGVGIELIAPHRSNLVKAKAQDG